MNPEVSFGEVQWRCELERDICWRRLSRSSRNRNVSGRDDGFKSPRFKATANSIATAGDQEGAG